MQNESNIKEQQEHRTTIYIVRHGESMATLDPALFAHMDPRQIPLTQWGYEQAMDAGKFLRDRYQNNPEFSGRKLRVFYSPHLRIVQSKDGILQALGKDRITGEQEEELLREREHGDFDGLDLDAQRARNPEIFAKLHATGKAYARARYETQMPNGESLKDVHERQNAFIESLKNQIQPGEDVVIVTHGGNCKFLEQGLMHQDGVMWFDAVKIPETGDIIEVQTDLHGIGGQHFTYEEQLVHAGKKRTASMPADYKAAAYVADTGTSLPSAGSGPSLLRR